jgi:hypothetical protein
MQSRLDGVKHRAWEDGAFLVKVFMTDVSDLFMMAFYSTVTVGSVTPLDMSYLNIASLCCFCVFGIGSSSLEGWHCLLATFPAFTLCQHYYYALQPLNLHPLLLSFYTDWRV